MAQQASKARSRSAKDETPAKRKKTAPVIETEETGWEELDNEPSTSGQGVVPEKEEQVTKVKLSRHQKQQRKKAEEAALRQAELRRLQGDAAPANAQEFEALLLSSPNSSFVWIKYMAFLISLGDIDRARSVAQRALDTINYREDGERFNVWVALLNLENSYGGEDATLSTLNRAVQHADARRMYLAAIDVFHRSQKTELLEQCLRAVTKKFGDATDVWLRLVQVRLEQGDAEAARAALARSLQSLHKPDHVYMITHTGLLEFKIGDPERGRSIFEGVLRNYPKRLDLWSVYIDQEIKQDDPQRIRALFERATHLQLPAKKMKFLFKRWLDFEKARGDEEHVAHVKRRAVEFVESVAASA